MNTEIIFWVAPEHEHREHASDWYWAISIITVSLAAAFIIVGNMLLSIVVLLGVGMLLYYSKFPPRMIEYKISKSGVRVGDKLHPWESLHSFWIIEKDEDEHDYHEPKLLLVSKKNFAPHVLIQLNEYILEDVRHVMKHMLPEEPRVEPFVERLARKAGF